MSQETVLQIVIALILLAGGWLIGGWLANMVSAALERAGLDVRARRLAVRIVQPVVVVIGFVVALDYLQIDLTPVTAMLGAATLAVGVALQGSLSNIASGAMLWTLKPYTEGEFVSCGGHSGSVVDQGAFAVLLERPDGVLVTIPNNVVFAQAIQNFSRKGRRRIEIAFLVEPTSDIDRAMQVLRDLMAADERLLDEPAPPGVGIAVEDRGVRLTARAWAASEHFGAAMGDLAAAAIRGLKEADVAFVPGGRAP